MKNKNDLISLSNGLGLTEREAKVYITLLSRKSFSASELQEAAGVPRTKIYEIVKKMINRGICAEKQIGNNKVYTAIEPKIAMEMIIEEQRQELSERLKLKEQLVEMFTPIYDEGRKKDEIYDYIEILKNKEQIHKKYLEMLDKAQHEILFFNKGPYSADTDKKIDEQTQHEVAFMKKGGVSKGLYEVDEFTNLPEFFLLLEEGQQARLTDNLPLKMLVFDGKSVLFALDEPYADNDLTMLSIEHKSIADAYKMLFEYIWINAKEIKK